MQNHQHQNTYTVGVISDTHGLLRPEAAAAFENTNLIIHAGDIGRPEVLDELRKISPVKAVRGNMDAGDWAYRLPATDLIEIGDVSAFVLHDIYTLDLDPVSAGIQLVVNGHTHKKSVKNQTGVLYVNPGTAGPFKPPLSVALITLNGMSIETHFIELPP